jgi:hypothetical protein
MNMSRKMREQARVIETCRVSHERERKREIDINSETSMRTVLAIPVQLPPAR